MPQFHTIYCARSDGAKAIRLPGGRFEENAPTPDQLSKELKVDKKTSAKCYDYYRELSENDAKHIDWRLKLGAMWASARGSEEHKSKGILFDSGTSEANHSSRATY
jgi:hypothetical protein